MSTWYRLWGSARLQTQSVQNWLGLWWPEEAIGGKKGGYVIIALQAIADRLDDSFIGSLDYSLAFDSLVPELIVAMFQHAGLPRGVCQILHNLWKNQVRYLESERVVHPRMQPVSTSFPLGDTWSVVAMVLALTPAIKDIKQRFPNTVLRTFIDDRTFASPPASEVCAVRDAWAEWSHFLGLSQNHDKIAMFHATASGRRMLQAKTGLSLLSVPKYGALNFRAPNKERILRKRRSVSETLTC